MGVETLVKDLREANVSGITICKDAIGAATEIAATYGSIYAGALGVFDYLFGSSAQPVDRLAEIQNALNNILSAIEKAFGAIEQHQQAQETLARLRQYDEYLSKARAATELARTTKVEHPSPTTYPCHEWLAAVTECRKGLEAASSWTTDYFPGLYDRSVETNIGDSVDAPVYPYTETVSGGTVTFSGTDLMWRCPKPVPDDKNLIWSYNYILPAYLEAVLHYVVITGMVDPNHRTTYKDVYLEIADFLLNVHNRIKDAIKSLRPPFMGDSSTLSSWFTAGKPFGAVEPYAPCTSIGCWPEGYFLGAPGEGTPQPVGNIVGMAGVNFVPKHAVRTLRRWKKVYVAVGLPVVWAAVNSMRRLAGEPSLGLDQSHWSLRELQETLRDAYSYQRAAAPSTVIPGYDALTPRQLAALVGLSGSRSLRKIVNV